MKVLSFFLLIFTFSNLAWATVEYGTLDVAGGSTSLVLNQGDVFEVTNFENKFSPSDVKTTVVYFTAPDDTIRNLYYRPFVKPGGMGAVAVALPNTDNMVIYGPTTITLGDVGWIMYKLTRTPNPQPAQAATEGN